MKKIVIYLYCTLFFLSCSGCASYEATDNSDQVSSSVSSKAAEASGQTDTTTATISETSSSSDSSITSSDFYAETSSDGVIEVVSGSSTQQDQITSSRSEATSAEQPIESAPQNQIDLNTSVPHSIAEGQIEQSVYFDKTLLYDSSGLTAGVAAVTPTSVWSEDVKAFIDSLPLDGLKILDEPKTNTLKKSTFAVSEGAILLLDTKFRYCMYLNTEFACLEFYNDSGSLNIEKAIYMQSTPELYNEILDNFKTYSK